MQINEIYYEWNTDGLSTEWLGWEREKIIFIIKYYMYLYVVL